jgi:hypothetical protein
MDHPPNPLRDFQPTKTNPKLENKKKVTAPVVVVVVV